MKKYSPQWFIYHLKNNGVSQWISSDRFVTLYMVRGQENLDRDIKYDFSLNNMDHIRGFQETESWHNYDTFVSFAEGLLENGRDCITYAEDGILLYSSWIGCDTDSSKFDYVGQTVNHLPKTATSFTGYTHPSFRGKGALTHAVKFAAKTAMEQKGQEQLIAAVDGNNIPAHRAHVSAGLEKIAELRTRRCLGRQDFKCLNIENKSNVALEPAGSSVWKTVDTGR